MTIKVFISGLSGNKEVKKRQQRVLMILDSKIIDYTVIDITEPGKESEKEFMQQNAKSNDSTGKANPLPPQIFNEDDYCGNYDEFDLSNEMDELEKFLKLPLGSLGSGTTNGTTSPKILSEKEKDSVPIEDTESGGENNNDPFEVSNINEIEEVFEMEEEHGEPDTHLYDKQESSPIDESHIVNAKEIEDSETADQEPEE